ncbi:MAG TPA: GAF domain-containing protein [Sediminispirochaeta sp.]|nr:GAF domain-containing protein [Sediminispirochaeta sp.]
MFNSIIDAEKLKTLIEINTLINAEIPDGRSLLKKILESAARLTNGESSSLLLVDNENQKLYFEIALGPKGPAVKSFTLNMGEGIAGWVAQNRTSLIVNDVDSDRRYLSEISSKISYPTESILAVPMILKDKCIGVIEIINKKNHAKFSNEDLQWLEVFAGQAALTIQNAKEYSKVQNEVYRLQDQVNRQGGFHTFVGKSKIIQEKLDIAVRAAQTKSSVLITGESGTGKELFAEQIHLNSPRADAPFIRVNCAALPEHLLESELFGHVKGAFTDAHRDRYGRFEMADGGTIFLDEIGEIPLALQSKLLGVLQSRSFQKVGASESTYVDVRILAATNKDIEQEVEEGRFREDLYYRLNVLPFHIPPLRERPDDIMELAEYFLHKVSRETSKKIRGLTQEAIDLLLSYQWPGNVRELENIIERAVVLSSSEYIQASDLLLQGAGTEIDENLSGKTLKEAVDQFKKHYILRVLEKNNWNQTKASKDLDIQRTYLSKLMKELGIR